MKNVIDKALDDIQKMKTCPGHEWEGPIEEIQFPDFVDYQLKCKHCPLRKGLSTRENAERLIGRSI